MNNQFNEFPKVSNMELKQAIALIKEDSRLTSAAYGLATETTIYTAGSDGYKYRRDELLAIGESEDLQQQLFTALRYLERFPASKSVGEKSPSSYQLKHWAERWGATQGFCGYVYNGILILAAKSLKFPMKGKGNPLIGISLKSIKGAG